MNKMGHSIKVGKYNTICMCAKCGYIFDTADDEETLNMRTKEHKEKTGHIPTYVEVDEKIAKTISILTSKGYYVQKCSQGGWPDYMEETLADNKGERKKPSASIKENTKMPAFYIRFKMNSGTLKQFRRALTEEAAEIYSAKYWEFIGTMITTLPNAFRAFFVYESAKDTLPRATIRQPKPKSRDLMIRWIPEMSLAALGDEQELETMMTYSYNKLEDWASNLPDINAYMMEQLGGIE